MPESRDSILDTLSRFPEKSSLYYKKLVTGEFFSYQPELPRIAAGVINNETLRGLGAACSRLNRRLFEPELSCRGIQITLRPGIWGGCCR